MNMDIRRTQNRQDYIQHKTCPIIVNDTRYLQTKIKKRAIPMIVSAQNVSCGAEALKNELEIKIPGAKTVLLRN